VSVEIENADTNPKTIVTLGMKQAQTIEIEYRLSVKRT
jgi:hypothetical protein